jgi:hypothetical protein
VSRELQHVGDERLHPVGSDLGAGEVCLAAGLAGELEAAGDQVQRLPEVVAEEVRELLESPVLRLQFALATTSDGDVACREEPRRLAVDGDSPVARLHPADGSVDGEDAGLELGVEILIAEAGPEPPSDAVAVAGVDEVDEVAREEPLAIVAGQLTRPVVDVHHRVAAPFEDMPFTDWSFGYCLVTWADRPPLQDGSESAPFRPIPVR